MRSLFTALGLILALAGGAVAQDGAPTVPTADDVAPAARLVLPALPDGLAADMARDSTGDAVEGRSLTNAAMANASGAYMVGDFESALLSAERAAAAGEPRGATLAAHIHLHGLAGEPDEAAAVRWLRRAAEQNEPDALIILAGLAEAGRGGLAAWQAREFLARAAEAGDARGAHEYGLLLMQRGDPGAADEALSWLQLAAESGRVEAFGDYAHALGDWVHGPNDLAAARDWYARAGEAGDAASALIAGVMLISGEGGEPDPIAGARLVRLSAEYGLPAGMGQYALLLFQGGAGLPANPVEAAGWAQAGAEAGDPDSQFLYAYALATGDGVARNPERAYYWVLRAGAPRGGVVSEDPDRDRLEAALERALSGPVRDRIQLEAAAAATPF